MKRLAIGFIVIAACSKAEDRPEPLPASLDVVALHDEAMSRVNREFLDWNYVVSRKPGGEAHHKGDSLLWTSLLVASSTCGESREIEQTLQRSILIGNGQLRRHYEIDDASIDGAIGLFRAVAKRIKLGCGSATSWIEPLEALRDYAAANQGRLNEHSSAGLDAFDYVLRALLDRLAGGSSPDFDGDRRDVLSELMASWSLGVEAAYNLYRSGIGKAPPAAYRVHLALLTLETLDDLGIAVPSTARNRFCYASSKMDLPTSDHWCGRRHISDWIPSFKYDEWEFRHQRAARWETPDGNGLRTPAIDLLYGIAQGYIL